MSLIQFLKDKKTYFIAHFTSLFLLMLFLSVLNVNYSGRVFVLIFMAMSHTFYLSYDYLRRYKFYKDINDQLDLLDRKTLISEFIETPNFYEGQILEHIVGGATKSMNDEILAYKKQSKDYQEYVETWVHEIKTPIAAANLVVDNNPNETTSSIHQELMKVESYVDQALYYARSHHVEKDYVIKPVDLDMLIKEIMRKHSKLLIAKKTQVTLDLKQDLVYSDHKWLTFILSQLVENSAKYSSDPLKLTFKSALKENYITLSIVDNGVGILKEDLPYVFTKGYVGSNGRENERSTGLGLYLCRELCQKMGLDILIDSDSTGTALTLVFPYRELINR